MPRLPTMPWLTFALSLICIVLPQPDPAHAQSGETVCFDRDLDRPTRIAGCSRALEQNPDNADVLAKRGELYRLEGELDQAKIDLDQALRHDPDNAATLWNRGEVHRRQGELDEALSMLNHSLDIAPNSAAALSNRGSVFRQLGALDRALIDLNRALSISPESAFALANRGEVLRRLDDPDKALVNLNRALELDPDYVFALSNRGAVHRIIGLYDKGLDDLGRAIELSPNNDFSYANRGKIFSVKGEYDSALRDLDRAIELDPESSFALRTRGEVFRFQGEYEKSLADLDRAIELSPRYAGGYAFRGETYRQNGQYLRAAADLEKSLELDPNYGWAHGVRGLVQRDRGDYQQALGSFQRALELDPSLDWVRRAEAKVLKLLPERDTTLASDPGVISRVQRLLAEIGFEPGPVDGIMGRQTRGAIRQFQASAGIRVTGEISAGLLVSLEERKAVLRGETQIASSDDPPTPVADTERPDALERIDEVETRDDAPTIIPAPEEPEPPEIEVAAEVEGGEPVLTVAGAVLSDSDVVRLTIDGGDTVLDDQGRFEFSRYLAEGEEREVQLAAFDDIGQRTETSVILRRRIAQAPELRLAEPNPALVQGAQRQDAVALIVGVADYDEPIHDALFADRDAAVFKDYAQLALGIPRRNIVHVRQEQASRRGVLEALHGDVAARVIPDRSEIFVFFAGHGLSDGKQRYLMPRNASARLTLLPDTTLSRERLLDDLEALQPTHITMFLDTCYTGETRGGDTLCEDCRFGQVRLAPAAERPNVTVIAAAGDDQVSVALEDQRHGLFSYWLFKGLEGEANLDQDDRITAGEMRDFLQRHVPRHSLSRQTPTLEGDPERVLVRLN